MSTDMNVTSATMQSRQAVQTPESAPRPDVKTKAPEPVEIVDPIEKAEAVKETTRLTHEQTRELMERLSDNLNALSQEMDRSLAFAVEEDIDRIVIVVSNPETGEQVRKLPSDTALHVAKSIETLKGILFDESV